MRTVSLLVFLALVSLSWKFECAGDTGRMHLDEDDSRILVMRGDKVVLQYNKVPTAEAAKHEPFYTRSGYIHPIYSPSGRVVTGDFAPDHKHQHGLFFAWTKTGFEGRDPEFWNQKLEKGRISFAGKARNRITLVPGEEKPAFCVFSVKHLWEDLTAPGGPKPVLEETWTVTAHDAGEDVFVFDIESSQELVATDPLTIEKYHYGGMAIRGSGQWYTEEKGAEPPGTMVTSEGLGRIEGNHSRPRWVAMHGPVDEGHAGIAVLGFPGNFRAPQWVRLHPTKPYFVWAPMVEEPFEIEPATPYLSRYRYVVFDGEADPAEIDERWKEWTAPEK